MLSNKHLDSYKTKIWLLVFHNITWPESNRRLLPTSIYISLDTANKTKYRFLHTGCLIIMIQIQTKTKPRTCFTESIFLRCWNWITNGAISSWYCAGWLTIGLPSTKKVSHFGHLELDSCSIVHFVISTSIVLVPLHSFSDMF
jgi:hypothetical protein